MAKSRARQWADLLAGTPVALDDSNRLTVGDADTASATLDVATSSGNASVEIQAPSDSHSILKFGDTADDDVGHITYDHTADYMSFTANASERMRINSSGDLSIGTTTSSGALTIDADSSTTNNRALHLTITDDDPTATVYATFIDYNISGATATGGDTNHIALRVDTDSSATGGDTTDEHRIYSIYNTVDVSGDSDLVYGQFNDMRLSHSEGTISNVYGVYTLLESDNSGGTVATASANRNLMYVNGTGSTTTAFADYNFTYLQNPSTTTTAYGSYNEVQIETNATVTNVFGVRSVIDENGGSSTAQYLFHGSYEGTPSGTGYGLYITGETDNYISGDLTVGGSITPGSYNTGQVIEELHAVCNTTSLHGRATIQSVTGSQTLAESYGDATGSVVTSYTPPSGTKMIVYEYTAHLRWLDAHAISHWRLYYQIDGGSWTEVTNARTNRNGYYPEEKQILRWVFEVGAGSTTAADGIFSAATPQLGFKWQCRDYAAANERGYLHLTQYWDGAGTDVFSKPMIMVKAIA